MNYNQQLNAMISALAADRLVPPSEITQAFGKRRVNACSKALSMLNLFVPVAGNFPQANSNATFTVYTKPLQRDVIVMGAAIVAFDQSTFTFSEPLGQFRLRLPAPLEHLSQHYIFPQMAFTPAGTSVFFPTPFILPASEQIAVDFGWNAPQANEFVDVTGRIELVLFCVAVKDCFSGDEQTLLRECAKVIATTPYQRRVLLNSVTRGGRAVTSQSNSQFQSNQDNTIVYDPQNVSNIAVPGNTLTSSETRPADGPLLVIGFAMNSSAGLIRITDTGTGYSFTQENFIYANNLFNANSSPPTQPLVNQTQSTYYSFFRLPVPHLLKPGATLFSEHLSTEIGGAGTGVFNPQYLVWECLTP